MLAFLDVEFTDLLAPKLLSLGMVTLDGREHYVELDLATELGQARRKAASDFVVYSVLDLWGMVPGAACTEWEMGRRTGEWLLDVAGDSEQRLEVAFDYPADYQLLKNAIREAGLWDRVRDAVRPVNVAALTGTFAGEDGAETCLRELGRRGLQRHHALADALALRAAYQAAKAEALSIARRGRPPA